MRQEEFCFMDLLKGWVLHLESSGIGAHQEQSVEGEKIVESLYES